MEVMYFFRNGTWIEYKPRQVVQEDPRWTPSLQKKAGAFYATAITKRYSEEKAHTLAEAYIFQQMYEGLRYSNQLEDELKHIMGL
jgi:hypothetical protein